ncbi:MMPL family transporter [Nocardioides daejeonensis]|uniref:MMPL family transporter n=1 Tax=Nocardioides daejeonensis TaxID=1046556 RepID=UPI000D740E78|nr:MMPL family transporter [Nocardioides daejeonensis]
MIDRWGRYVARRSLPVLLIALLVAGIAAAFGAGVFGSLSNGGFDDPDTESARELALERETFGNQAVDVIAIYSSDTLRADAPAFQSAVEQTLAELPDGVTATPWFAAGDPSMTSHDGHAATVLISLAGETQDENSDSFEEIKDELAADGLEVELAGPWAVYTDVNHITSDDLARAELIALPLVLLLSLVIFGSLVAASMPVLVGGVAVVGALGVLRLIAGVTEVSIFSVNIITLLGMGLAIDYALFVVSRFREELALRAGDDPEAVRDALRRTMATAGRTVLFSGLTVAAAMSSLLVFPQNFLRSIGYGGMAAVLVAMVASLTVLPAVLGLLGRRIDAGRVPFLNRSAGRRAQGEHGDTGAWSRLAHAVMRRPIVFAVAITAVLLAIGSPFLGVKWGSVDYRVLPDDAPSHVAAERLNTDFGPERSTANVTLRGADEEQVATYAADLLTVDRVVDVHPVAEREGVTLLRVAWEGNSQTEASQQVVRDLREVATPGDSEALIGGLSADTVDLLGSIGHHLPWMALVVVLVMLVLLFLAFGSLVLPVKAVLMNALSITASFGVVTWIFADGHLEGPLGYTSSGFLDATQPILMLAILFGLSMDYEVFLLSRVREQWDATHDNDLAVATGVQKTGRIITSAALLLAIVIGAFGTSGIVFMKMIGIGMLVALLIDATVVRALLVPATMKLLGDFNWWAPAPLARWWQRYGFREESRTPGEQVEDGTALQDVAPR